MGLESKGLYNIICTVTPRQKITLEIVPKAVDNTLD